MVHGDDDVDDDDDNDHDDDGDDVHGSTFKQCIAMVYIFITQINPIKNEYNIMGTNLEKCFCLGILLNGRFSQFCKTMLDQTKPILMPCVFFISC